VRPGKPYPATFRLSVDPPGIEPGLPVCRTGVFPLDHEPVLLSGPDGNRTHHTDLARISRLPWYMPARFVRGPSGSRTRSPSLPRTCATGTPTDRRVSDPGWNRTITLLPTTTTPRCPTQASSPLDHGIMSVTRVGVEPTKSRGSRPRRFACLRTRPSASSGSGSRTPAVQAYEARMSTGPPASCRSRYRAGQVGLMKPNWAPAAPAIVKVAKGRFALPRPFGHDGLSVARLLIPPLGCVLSDPDGT
jgi:hypothetical protein